jgi:hypothetical protein
METAVSVSDGTPTKTETAVGGLECERCGDPAYIQSYWGEALCQPCVHALAEIFDQKGEWPPGMTV